MTDHLTDAITWARNLTWGELPPSTRSAAVTTTANVVGLGVAGTSRPELVALRAVAAATAGVGAGEVPVLGTAQRLDPVAAALVHGTAMHVEDFDDTHLATVLHPGAPIVPVALALGTYAQRTGAEVLTAITAGVELASRAGLALGREHFDRAWHLTSTVGRIGGAVAAGMLVALPPERLRTLLALATATFAGHTEQLGTMAKPLHPGKAAADLVRGALDLASGRLASEPDIAVAVGPEFAGVLDWAGIVVDLGTRWEIEANTAKPYACGIVSHPVIDGGRRCRAAGPSPERITEVRLTVHSAVPAVMGVQDPPTGLRSKFSAHHCFAIGLLFDDGGLAEFSDEVATRADVRRIRDLVTLVVDESMPMDSCRAQVRTADGVETIEVEHATGSLGNPMSGADLRRKFLGLTRGVLADPEGAWAAVTGLERAPSTAELLAATTTGDAHPRGVA